MTQAVPIEGNPVQQLDRISNWLMGAIVAAPFAISARSLAHLAEMNGVQWGWLYPVMVDGGLAIFKLLSLRSSLQGERDWFNLTMAGVMTALSVALNMMHVDPTAVGDVGLARFMAALPPVIILLAFVAISRRIEASARRQQAEQALADLETAVVNKAAERDALSDEIAALRNERDALTEALDQLASERSGLDGGTGQTGQRPTMEASRTGRPERSGRTEVSDKLLEVLGFLEGHPEATRAEIGEAIGRSRSTVSDYLKQLREAGRLSKNGHGWAVIRGTA